MYVLSPDVKIRKEKYGGIAFSNTYGAFFDINKSALNILEYFQEPISELNLQKIATDLHMPVDDLSEFLQSATGKGLILIIEDKNLINRHGIIIDNKSYNNDHLSFPIELVYYITNRCNQRCPFCYNANYREQSNREELNYNLFYKSIKEAKECGGFSIGIMGGEPMLNYEFIKAALREINDEMNVDITTNGTVGGGINEEQVSLFSKYKNININISIHGLNENEHDKQVGSKGSFNKAIESIKTLVKNKIKVNINYLATASNINSVYGLAIAMKSMGVSSFELLYPMPYYGQKIVEYLRLLPNSSQYHSVILKLIEIADASFKITYNSNYLFLENPEYKLPIDNTSLLYHASKCAAGNIRVNVMPNGDVFTCPITIGIENYKIGNIKTDSLYSIWNSQNLSFFRKRAPELLQNMTCKTCDFKNTCIGGCPIVAEIFGESSYSGDPRCNKITRSIL